MFMKRLGTPLCALLALSAVLVAGDLHAEEDGRVDENTLLLFDDTPRFDNLAFDIDDLVRIRPQKNDFELLNFAPMSNKLGERWVLVTVRNTSSGRRFLKSEHIVATFANQDQAYPLNLNQSVGGGEISSKIVFFGINKFPIIII